MNHKIFLSHNHLDKPVVEPVAVRLASIFGQDQIFYDSWSIRPGDGIIDKMNNGLSAPEFVFFFVSDRSLSSGMVKLEWQNALYAASKGQTRIIPVRVDGTPMPPVLMQTLYIDMHAVGLEVGIAQIVAVTQGHASFTPQHEGFSNLSYTTTTGPDGAVDIVIRASHLMEPNPQFLLLVRNAEGELKWEIPGPGFYSCFKPNLRLTNGEVCNGITMRPAAGTLTPAHPVRLKLSPLGNVPIALEHVLHERAENNWVNLPRGVSTP